MDKKLIPAAVTSLLVSLVVVGGAYLMLPTVTKTDGVTVVNGKDGQDGKDGARGAQGPKGDKGDTGAQGPKGDKGDRGDRGVSTMYKTTLSGSVSGSTSFNAPNDGQYKLTFTKVGLGAFFVSITNDGDTDTLVNATDAYGPTSQTVTLEEGSTVFNVTGTDWTIKVEQL